MPVTVVAKGLGFLEGPVVISPGRIVCVDMRGQAVYQWDGTAMHRLARNHGAPNGACLGADGWVYLANNGGIAPDSTESVWFAPDSIPGGIQRLASDGSLETVVDQLPGPSPHRPNDLCFGPDSWLYFTDPKNWETVQSLTPDESGYLTGALLRTDGRGTTQIVAEISGFPNGLAFTPAGDELIVAQTIHHRLLSFRQRGDGSFAEPTVWCTFHPSVNPDGFCFDTRGNLYLAGSTSNSVLVISSAGKIIEEVQTGAQSGPTNCCLEPGRLWITMGLGGALAYVDVDAEPSPLYATFLGMNAG